ncbi:patatin [Agrobacterium tumefaciens]|uniref:patatin-like phospholipase family protein n=1 Tax=Agrobacterium tumefaciens TaxID=358 RepID=UPI00157326F7|nr:patatin-like phospholipase family protein [Agrobacterium tumefaciens]NTB99452.1 patatin [Agrobacterium tumefaciens]NTC46943.1 patatin [Agrobacterium tumefaciens]
MPENELPKYQPDMFAAPEKECDVVMKGGITSGVVYPYAVLELARRYRFHSIGGTSAGAIAAAFAAAAEYSRTVRNDPNGFTRLQAHCDTIPTILDRLFQPQRRFRPLMRYLLWAQAGGWPGKVLGLLLAFPLAAIVGIVIGAGALWVLGGGWAGSVLGGLVGMLAGILGQILWLVFYRLPRDGFGFCSGLTVSDAEVPGLTEWLHASIQDIAFGSDAATAPPLTFGDLIGAEPEKPVINLKMVTTNLSMRRPHTLPTTSLMVAYDPTEWSQLFPAAVMNWLKQIATPGGPFPELKAFPEPAQLPVIIATRMSLSFPVLFKAIPAYTNDRGTLDIVQRLGGKARPVMKAKIWFSDGGISSNFPIHLFDALLPSRPTFALSLDELPKSIASSGKRVTIPQAAGEGIGVPVHKMEKMSGFLGSILSSAKDWQDQSLATMPGQRERIARVFLNEEEGGLNLTMPPERSAKLMSYGLEVGSLFANGALDFDEHRWRRTLVAYDRLEDTVFATERLWNEGKYQDWLTGYIDEIESYEAVTKGDREKLIARIAAFAALSQSFSPAIANKRKKFPNPAGRLRIGPDI